MNRFQDTCILLGNIKGFLLGIENIFSQKEIAHVLYEILRSEIDVLLFDYTFGYYGLKNQLVNDDQYQSAIRAMKNLKGWEKKEKKDQVEALLIAELGVGYEENNDMKKALEYYKSALEIDPANIPVLDLMIQVYMKEEDYAKVEKLRQKKVQAKLNFDKIKAEQLTKKYAEEDLERLREIFYTKKEDIANLYELRPEYRKMFEKSDNLLLQVQLILKDVRRFLRKKDHSIPENNLASALEDVMHVYFDWMSILSGLAYYHLKFKLGGKDIIEEIIEGFRNILGYEKGKDLKDSPELIPPGRKAGLYPSILDNPFPPQKEFLDITDPNQREAIEDLHFLTLHNDVEYETRNGKVIEVWFWQNWIEKLPKSIAFLDSLEDLTLEMNCLRSLPESFIKLTSLRKVYLGGNKFKIFPEQLFHLPLLETIDMGNNKLSTIPDLILNLRNLKSLDLSYNLTLKKIPESLAKLEHLELLDLIECYDVIVPEALRSKKRLTIRGLDDLQVDELGNVVINLSIRDFGTPTVDYYRDEELRKKVVNPDDIVIRDEKINIRFTYPLSTEVILSYESKGGFNRLDLYRCIYEGYKQIYEEEEQAVGDPGMYQNLMNRRKSDGPYGIWGHSLSGLWIEGISYNPKTKTVDMRIGS